jgi:hypothetical protein
MDPALRPDPSLVVSPLAWVARACRVHPPLFSARELLRRRVEPGCRPLGGSVAPRRWLATVDTAVEVGRVSLSRGLGRLFASAKALPLSRRAALVPETTWALITWHGGCLSCETRGPPWRRRHCVEPAALLGSGTSAPLGASIAQGTDEASAGLFDE